MVKYRDNHPFQSDGGFDLSLWLQELQETFTDKLDLELIHKAAVLAKEKGADLQTPLQVSCYQQGLAAADILYHLGLDPETIAAAIVFDCFRFAKLSEEMIVKHLNAEVAALVLGAGKMQSFHTDKKIQQTENLRRLLLAVVEDLRVVLLSLANYTAEMHAAIRSNDEIRKYYAMDAREIYAPLANRLGIGQIKWELEDLAFRFLEPIAYKHIAQLLDERRIDRDQYILKTVDEIKQALASQSLQAEVTGRAKHIFSIWKKMQKKGVGYDEIYDVNAVRILLSSVTECYTALGVVHGLWRHIPKEFDDYIANPKTNGYRSLHTAVIGPEGRIIEVQIRTRDMHKQSELGVAAHWRYKEGVVQDEHYETKLVQLRQILKWQEDWVNDTAFSDAFKAEVFKDRVYVLTPKGKVVDLSSGATVLDFAYHIHSEIGNHCRGAKVNGRMVPLTHILKSGDRVEIITNKTGSPSRDWLNPHYGYLATSRARSKVLHWFRQQDREQQHSYQHQSSNQEPEPSERLAHAHKIEKPQIDSSVNESFDNTSDNSKLKERAAEITVLGVGNLFCQIARCCKPLPGDEIIGYITIGKGVSVHRKDCNNILQATGRQLSRLVEVEWGEKTRHSYSANLIIVAHDRQGLIKDISAILSNEDINVNAIRGQSNKEHNKVTIRLTVEIPNKELLNKIFKRLQQLPNLLSIKREGTSSHGPHRDIGFKDME